MVKRKPSQTFDLPALADLEKRLIAHRAALAESIRQLPDPPTFDHACLCRDAAQLLVTTCMVIGDLDMQRQLITLTKEPQNVPFLADCELDQWPPTPEN